MILAVDAGSTYLKYVLLNNSGELILKECIPSGINFEKKIKYILKKHNPDNFIATGYGRHFLRENFNAEVITEIKAHAFGAYYIDNKTSTVIDLGGQDSKVIRVNSDGTFGDFIMNDKCAAGTGKFIEIVCSRLEIALNEIDKYAQNKAEDINISSMCAVFAESEVISLISKGKKREDILYGVLNSIATKLVNMAKRVGVKDKVLFSGGGAKSKILKEIIEKKLSKKIITPPHPQFLGAIGAGYLLLENMVERVK